MKKTLLLGATTNPSRYAYLAAEKLIQHGHPIVPVGVRKGSVFGHEIITDKTQVMNDIDTITLYVGKQHQLEWYDYILATQPRRIVYNPGTENPELMKLASEKGIENEIACTLVLLGSGQY